MDLQYPVTVTRHDLKKAFTSWDDLNRFIDGITNSLYNGLYIDEYNNTKALVTQAYNSNAVQMQVTSVTPITRPLPFAVTPLSQKTL